MCIWYLTNGYIQGYRLYAILMVAILLNIFNILLIFAIYLKCYSIFKMLQYI
jgi:hypothetical protein